MVLITRIRCSGSRVRYIEQSSAVPIHLCGFHEIESAPSMPSNSARHSGSSSAEPAIAASTCTHAPYSRAISTTGAIGSNAVVPVVPRPRITAAGLRPAATSASIAARSASGRSA